jgi:hypothetical protein
MQNSELFRRGVVLPLDDHAEWCLRANKSYQDMHVDYLPIIDDPMFECLWSCGILQEINRLCGTLIDEYEEEFVEVQDILSLIGVFQSKVECVSSTHADIAPFLSELGKLAQKAAGIGRPLLFVL